MNEPSWPPRVRESHDPKTPAAESERPRAPEATDEPPAYGTPSVDSAPETSREPRSYAPDPAAPGTAESIGAVDHERTEVRREPGETSRDDGDVERDADRRSTGRSRLVIGLLVGTLVLMTALAATFLALWLGSSETGADEVQAYMDEQRPEIEERTRTAVDILINYDSANIDQRRTEMLAISTGGFRDDYEQFTDTLGDALKEAGASSRGSILDEPRITFIGPAEADAVLRTEQIAQTRENPGGRTIEYIMRLGLVDTQGGWKVDSIEILSDELS